MHFFIVVIAIYFSLNMLMGLPDVSYLRSLIPLLYVGHVITSACWGLLGAIIWGLLVIHRCRLLTLCTLLGSMFRELFHFSFGFSLRVSYLLPERAPRLFVRLCISLYFSVNKTLCARMMLICPAAYCTWHWRVIKHEMQP